jgi:hypothetical protein
MPDRFADGDVSNDDPPGTRRQLDRREPRRYHGGDLQGIIDRLLEFEAAPARLPEGGLLRDRLAGQPPVRVRNGKIKTMLPPRTAVVYAPEEARP